MTETLDSMLPGGHPNSLGRTEDAVEAVLADNSRFDELFSCYGSDDEVVRLRTSSAMKRVVAAKRDLLVPYIDRFITEIGALDQASAQWTLPLLFAKLVRHMNPSQKSGALAIMKRNLADHDDWIVLGYTMDTLASWAKADDELHTWLKPHLVRLSKDPRKSVSKKATKLLAKL